MLQLKRDVHVQPSRQRAQKKQSNKGYFSLKLWKIYELFSSSFNSVQTVSPSIFHLEVIKNDDVISAGELNAMSA